MSQAVLLKSLLTFGNNTHIKMMPTICMFTSKTPAVGPLHEEFDPVHTVTVCH